LTGDFDPLRDYATEMDPPGSILGSPWSLLFAGSLKGWPTNPIRAEFRQVQPSDVETLLVSGSIDFSTPAEFATDELLPYLTRGQQVILAEMGHAVADLFNVQPEATERLLTSFYDTGVADDSLYIYAPMDFSVSLGFPTLAKLLVAGTIGFVFMTWLQSRFARVNAAVLFIALLFFAWLWGVWGLLLGAPLLAIAKVICDRVEALKPVGELLGR